MYRESNLSSWTRSNSAYAIKNKMRRRRDALTDVELNIVAPSIFADNAHHEVSARYNQIDTRKVIDGLRGEGWAPVWVSEQNVRNKSRAGFQKHIMRFRHADTLGISQDVGDEFPEIVLINSHDRTSSFQIHAGLFRLVCGNGMVVADSTFSKLRVTHLSDADAVINAALQVPGNIPQIVDKIDAMKRCEIPEDAQLALAGAAAILRWGDLEKAPIEPQQLLSAYRREDEGANLWKTFNRVQEGVIKGGQRYVKRTEKGLKRGRVREVKGIDQNTTLNKALWHVAETLGERFN